MIQTIATVAAKRITTTTTKNILMACDPNRTQRPAFNGCYQRTRDK